MEPFFEPVVSKPCVEKKYNPKFSNNSLHNNKMGYEGEKEVEYHLKKSNIGMYIMNDINLSIDGFNAQVDFVVVTSHHCYFIECKNFNARIIHADENGNFEISSKGKRHTMTSPLFQADEQLSVFERIYLRDKENTDKIFNNLNFKDYFKTIAVFANPENRLRIDKAPYKLRNRILKIDGLVNYIKEDDNHSSIHIPKEQMEEIANYFLKNDKGYKPDSSSIIREKKLINTDDVAAEAEILYKTGKINNNQIDELINKIENLEKEFNNKHYESPTTLPDKTDKVTKREEVSETGRNNNPWILLTLFFITIAIAILFFGTIPNKKTSNSNDSNTEETITNQNNNINTTKQVVNKSLNDNTINALNNLKNAYNNAKQYGFDLYDYNSCLYLKESLFDSLTCSGKPMQVNYISDNNISIYKNFNCYYLKYDLNNKKIISSSQKYVGYNNECPGKDIGLIHYDSTNQYLAKIGGYNRILRMARYAYNKTSGFDGYYDFSHVSERGGNPNLTTTYKTFVDDYFRTISNKCDFACKTNSLEEFNKMVEYFYYIMR